MDVVIVVLPRINTEFGFTPAGPAAIKGCLNAAGFSNSLIDLNLELEKAYSADPDTLSQIDGYCENYNFHNHRLFKELDRFFETWAKKIVDLSPSWVGFSVFSTDSYRPAKLLSLRIKALAPDIKIVVGGGGVTTTAGPEFFQHLIDQKIIDYYITGEGEISLIELLNGNTSYPGINNSNPIQVLDIESLPYPDYSDYDLPSYENFYGKIMLPITGSRGCVRKCTFCDVNSQWNKFTYRSGESIANEIVQGIEKYQVKNFVFTDSLMNGSRRAFADMVARLSDFRKNLPENKKFTYDGHFIIRGEKHMPPVVFDQMKDSGIGTLWVGIESGSSSVRDHMKKGFSQEDLDYSMEQFHRCGIKIRMLMIVGYPTETEQDFQETLDMFERYQKYQSVIEEVKLGTTLLIFPGTPLYDHKDDLGITNSGHVSSWVYKKNPTLTFKERIRRRIILEEKIKKLGYNFYNSNYQANLILMKWREYQNLESYELSDNFQFDRELGGLKTQNEDTNIFKIIQS